MALTPSGSQRPTIAAEGFLRALADHGVDYFLANPGTDFPPIVEAFSRAKKTHARVPKPVLVPHENLAVAMAHGAYLMNGRPQAVMVHVNVGTANTINNLTNLSRDRVPLILAAGRTYPDPKTIATLAEWIAGAERPLIITSVLPSNAVAALSALAERCAIPVVTHNPRSVCLPSSHPMHFGYEPGALLADADLVIVLESDVPWIPHLQHPPGSCR